MPVVSRDVIWPLSQIRVISSELANLHVRRLHQLFMSRAHACSSGAVFVTVTVRAARCRKPTSIAETHGRSQRRCARTPHRRRIASEKLYTAAVPTAALESDRRDSNCGSPCEGKFVLIVRFSPIAGVSALNMAGPQWVYAIFHG